MDCCSSGNATPEMMGNMPLRTRLQPKHVTPQRTANHMVHTMDSIDISYKKNVSTVKLHTVHIIWCTPDAHWCWATDSSCRLDMSVIDNAICLKALTGRNATMQT